MARFKDLTGRVFFRLTVKGLSKKEAVGGKLMWVCQCLCGKITEVRADHLDSGNTRSCGCLIGRARNPTNAPAPRPNRFPLKEETVKKICSSCGVEFVIVFNINNHFERKRVKVRKKCERCILEKAIGRIKDGYD